LNVSAEVVYIILAAALDRSAFCPLSVRHQRSHRRV